jgi:hypothetical protein
MIANAAVAILEKDPSERILFPWTINSSNFFIFRTINHKLKRLKLVPKINPRKID